MSFHPNRTVLAKLNRYHVVILLYFIAALMLAPVNLLSFDSYYYWDWSRTPGLSYYDGSPMIAYFIRLATLLFGDTLFALTVVGIVILALTTWINYKTARLFLAQESSYVVLFLWLFSPLVTLDILRQSTYDSPLLLFWTLVIYFVVRFITGNRIRDLYFVGVSIGLMLLSKYSGVVLIIGLLIFLITGRYRYLFKSYHFYAALLLALLVFSPVVFWNYQHDWLSFAYQLKTHQLSETENPLLSVIRSWFSTFLPFLNFMLLPPLILWIKQKHYLFSVDTEKSRVIAGFCRLICTVFLCFYLFTASKAGIRECWLTPYLVTSALLAGYCFEFFYYRKSAWILITLYGITSLGIIINNSLPFHFVPADKFKYYSIMQQINRDYPKIPEMVVTSGWAEARMLFFLNGKPDIYTIDCDGSLQNQYALWSNRVKQEITDKSLKQVLFIDKYDRSVCLSRYFDHCERFPAPGYVYGQGKHVVYVFNCSNGFWKAEGGEIFRY